MPFGEFNPEKDYTGYHNPPGKYTALSYWYMPKDAKKKYDKENRKAYDNLIKIEKEGEK